MLTAVRDVRVRRQAVVVAQLAASLVEYSEDAIIGGTIEGVITSWNPAAARMYGYSSEEIIGQPVRFLTPVDRAEEIEKVLEKIRAGRPVERFETRRVRKDGAKFPAFLTVSAIRDADGAVVGTSVIYRELTGRGDNPIRS